MSAFAFVSDLDRTLIHPLRDLPPQASGDAVVVERYLGRPITVVHRALLTDLVRLASDATVVPATTRSRAQLERVCPMWRCAREGWAICANGATVLQRGVEDRAWSEQVALRLRDVAPLAAARRALDATFGLPAADRWLLRWRSCDERFLYAICDAARTPADAEQAARDALEPLGWTAVLNGRKLYALPRALTKDRAARFVCERVGVDRMLAAGDSALDAGLLAMADRAFIPGGSELAFSPTRPAHAELIDLRHIAAGRRIVAAVLEDLQGRGADPVSDHASNPPRAEEHIA